MDVVGHEAVCQRFEAVFLGILQQQLQISLAVVISEEDIFAAIAPLGEMVRNTWDDNPCDAWHAAILQHSPLQSRDK
jgi:hypothetical protein